MFQFNDLFETFLEKRQIPIFELINPEQQSAITKAILYLNARDTELPITLVIDCIGGDGWPGRMVADVVQNSSAPVDGLVVGDAQSSAFRILQMCRHRRAYPNARLMFYRTEVGMRVGATKEERRFYQEVQTAYEALLRLISKRSGQSVRQLRAWSIEQRPFLATDALRYGFIDTIVRKRAPRK